MENNKLYSERNLSREFLFTFIQTEKQWRYATVPIIVWIYTHIFEYVPLLIHVFWHLWIKQNKNKQICSQNLCFFRSKYLHSYFALSFGNMWNVDFPTAIGPQFQTNRLYIRLTFATQMYLRWHLCTSVSTQLYHWLRQWRYWARHAGVEPNTAFETEASSKKRSSVTLPRGFYQSVYDQDLSGSGRDGKIKWSKGGLRQRLVWTETLSKGTTSVLYSSLSN